jgi:salicylate hydroxylase
MNREIGALLSLQPNASKIATSLGLDKFLAKKGPMKDRAFRIFNVDGEKQVEIPSDTDKYGAPRMVYHRVDLHDALKEAVTDNRGRGSPGKIIPCSRVASVNCEDGIVFLENGRSYQGDIIIGADGIHSVVRTSVLGSEASQPQPTGTSAYRLLLETIELEKCTEFMSFMDPRDPATTMIVGHDRRVIMGPGRSGNIFGVVALVPDEHMHEQSSTKSWTSEGSLPKLLESFSEFPAWVKDLFNTASEAPALYQLRDIDPLSTWIRGRAILIGDAAHAMLPTQGQGASQSFEDAEALQAFLGDVTATSSQDEIRGCLESVFEARYARATLIQAYSRQQARPATDKGSKKVKLNPAEFMDYNCKYEGAKDWCKQQSGTDTVISVESLSKAISVIL